MSSPRPRKRRAGRPELGREDGRERLLGAALQAFAARGFEGANLRAVAAEAGVDPALVAHHFGSKIDLWKAAVASLQPDLTAALALCAAPPAGDPALRRLSVAVEALCDLHAACPALPRLLARELGEPGERLEHLEAHVLRGYREALLPPLREAVEFGALPPQDVDLLFALLLGALLGPSSMATLLPGLTGEALRAAHKRVLLTSFLQQRDVDPWSLRKTRPPR